jgi:hypothetical protein
MTIRVYTMQEALNEYQSLLNDDDHFSDQWNNTKKDFEEWCNLYDVMISEVA